MENVIYYFSGTGNSYYIAKRIAAFLPRTEVVNIADIACKNIDLLYERVGIVFPVYYGGLPPMVHKFVDKLRFGLDNYVFSVVTKGGMSGAVNDELAAVVAERGGRLNAAFKVSMPGNFIAVYGAFPEPIQNRMLRKADITAERIAEAAAKKLHSRHAGDTQAEKIKNIAPLTERIKNYGAFSANYRVSGKCNGCGRCAKVCPSQNIKLENNRPLFSSKCERCMACIQWCPQNAIAYMDKTTNRKRYHHPKVIAEQLYREH
jgi:ferredoxin/flavodoxin